MKIPVTVARLDLSSAFLSDYMCGPKISSVYAVVQPAAARTDSVAAASNPT